jgi:hypothetical protein
LSQHNGWHSTGPGGGSIVGQRKFSTGGMPLSNVATCLCLYGVFFCFLFFPFFSFLFACVYVSVCGVAGFMESINVPLICMNVPNKGWNIMALGLMCMCQQIFQMSAKERELEKLEREKRRIEEKLQKERLKV